MTEVKPKKLSVNKRMFNRGIERAADYAKEWLEDWGSDLAYTRDEYLKAIETGKMNGRKIDPNMARKFASEFNERAEAVYRCGEQLKNDMQKLKRK